jgi:hypothetical protein
MGYAVRVVADSVGPNRVRLTTVEMTYPLIIHNELMTHRMFSRNTASNRAIPVERMIAAVEQDPFVPARWPKNQKGMQAQEWLEGVAEAEAEAAWYAARDAAVAQAHAMLAVGVHKQITNRLLAPWLYTTAVVTATHWANFFNLRCHPDAQPEMKALAYMVQRAYLESTPRQLEAGEWHTPYVEDTAGLVGEPWLGAHYPSDREEFTRIGWGLMVSAGRCAAVSYLRQGEQKGGAEAFDLAIRLTGPGHWSPFEHQARAMPKEFWQWSGNFFGWVQFRKLFARENQLVFLPNHPGLIGTGHDTPVVNPS